MRADTYFRSLRVLLVSMLLLAPCAARADGNRLAYLDAFCDPYYVGRDFPKLTTPQWIGEDGVEAVIVLSIDDMRGYQKWERYLRSIVDRLKKIDGRAPVSIMTCRIDPQEPHLQAWLKEGLSLEVHTIDHPCPCLQGGDFPQASKTYHDCVDLMASIPDSHPVAFRMPCCDSRNTPSPRFWTEIFNRTSPKGNFLHIDSSVFNITTEKDTSLPRDLVLGEDGKPRFRRYVPFPSYVNTIEDYPYPYVIGRLCWQFPCTVPSDWEAQHVQRPNNPRTVADMQRAIDAAVHKQGVFTLVFHPHGWIRNDQIVELIDYAEKEYGRRVKFLNFRECAQRFKEHLLAGQTLRAADGGDNGVRLLDVNHDGFLDVVIGNEEARKTRVWMPEDGRWRELDFPVPIVATRDGRRAETGVRFGVVNASGHASVLILGDEHSGGWHFTDEGWKADRRLTRGLKILDRDVRTCQGGVDRGVRLRDLDGDGRSELIAGGPDWQGVFRWDAAGGSWQPLPFALPANTFIVDRAGRDAGLRFVDINEDGRDDVLFSDEERWSAHLFTSLEKGWSQGAGAARQDDDFVPPIVRGATNNGAWFHSEHLWVQNEDTHRLPDGVARLPLAKLLKRIKRQSENTDERDGARGQLPPPQSAEDSLGSFQTKADLTVKLVAAEPLVVDPIAFDWGPDGRLWVVEMRDYPNGLDGRGRPGGRVKALTDTDDDGRYDRATTFLDGLPFPTGVKVWRDGVLVTAAPRILFARDTDNDGRADDVQTLYEGFGEGNQQHRVNGLRWGLDNWLYVGNGDSGGEIRSHKTGERVDLRSRDLRIRPDNGRLQAISGNTQYGIDRDDWGNWFGGNNSHPVWHYVLDDVYLRRNPHFAPPAVKREIAASPGAARVFPISRTLERFNNPHSANHFTSACSPMIYRDRRLGERLYGNVFVCEPVHNLVHREIVSATGNTFTSRRADDERASEFLASGDNWFRPTMIRTGPDGALWIADMYRLVIEHPVWIPEHFQRRYDVRAGDDRGRIYRIVPQGESPKIPRLDELSTEQLVAKLADENGPVRDLAQQMLIWRNDAKAIEPLEEMATRGTKPRGRLHALCTLDGLGKLRKEIIMAALRDEHAGVRRHGLRLSEQLVDASPAVIDAAAALVDDADAHVHLQLAYTAGMWRDGEAAGRVLARLLTVSDDQYLHAAAMSSFNKQNVGHVLVNLIRDDGSPQTLFGKVLGQAAALGASDALLPALERITKPAKDDAFASWQFRAADHLLEQLNGNASAEDVGKLLADQVRPMMARAGAIIAEDEAPPKTRVAALGLLRWASADNRPAAEELVSLLQPSYPPEVQQSALHLITAPAYSNPELLHRVLKQWQHYTPGLRGALLDELLGRAADTRVLLEALEDKTLHSRHLNADRRRRLLEHPDATIRRRAAKLLDALAEPAREQVVQRHAATLKLPASADRGRQLFAKHCAACHRLEGVGHEVGPDLAALTDRSPTALLTAVLDPNRAVEDKYLSYTALTDRGRIYSGMLVAEAGQSLTLRTAEGKPIVLLRNRLEEFRATEKSFMPEGLERDLKPQQLADIIEHVRSVGPSPKRFEGNRPAAVRPDENGVIHLPAAAARIYGSRLVFESKYENLGWWQAADDRAEWTVKDAAVGEYEVHLDYACHDDVAGNRYRLRLGGSEITGRVVGTGTWDDYRWWKLGNVELKTDEFDVTFEAAGSIRGALVDLREIRLTPVQE